MLHGYDDSEIKEALADVDKYSDEYILKYCDYKQIGLFADDMRSEEVMFQDSLRSRSHA